MSQSEILNYDPLRISDREDGELEEVEILQELSLYVQPDILVGTIIVPASELTGKTEEEITRYAWRSILAFDIDVDSITLDPVQDVKIISEIIYTLANHMERVMLVNLTSVYLSRLERQDGCDPEFKLRGDTEKEDLESLIRVMGNLHTQARIALGITDMLNNRLDDVIGIWRVVSRNVLGRIELLILDEKGDDHEVTQDDRDAYVLKYSEELSKDVLRFIGERWAALTLERLNPAGIPFSQLKEIVRRGLGVRVSISDVLETIDRLMKLVKAQDGGFCVIEDKRIILELPDDTSFSQDIGLKLLFEKAKHGGYKPVYFKWTEDILRKFLAAYEGKYKGLLETAKAELRTLAKTHSNIKPVALTLYNKKLDQDIILSLVNYVQGNGKYTENDLAVEQAARFAGVPKNAYKPSSLRTKLTEARNLPPLDFNAGASNE